VPQRTGTSHIAFRQKLGPPACSLRATRRADPILELRKHLRSNLLVYFDDPKFFSISSQLTTFHQASTYSGRRF
jgi:hypothetical protein